MESNNKLKIELLLYCPHCNEPFIVKQDELNCHIFRHGFDIRKQEQICPHLSEENCILARKNPDIIGCCMPFRVIIVKDGEYKTEKCDYI
jgi:hypothetical protein